MARPGPQPIINPDENASRESFSVSGQDGINNLATYRDVKNTMETQEYSNRLGVYDTGDLDAYQHLNPALFQIISTGINSIVKQLKLKLGNNFTENNESAKAIMDLLDNLSTTITTEDIKLTKAIVNDNLTPQNVTIDNINKAIDDDNVTSTNLDQFKSSDDYLEYGTMFKKDIGQQIIAKDTPLQLNENDFDNGNLKQDSKLMVRLRNCQNLEFLYLKKHDEILKIFAFTINLFDKYKYAVKVMLYLLKNLVDKDYIINELGPPVEIVREVPGEVQNIYPTVTLPAKIITNMKKLLADQKTIQGVITQMNTTLKSNDKLNKFDKNIDPKDVINTELGKEAPGAPGIP
jgi:hypothetical protein